MVPISTPKERSSRVSTPGNRDGNGLGQAKPCPTRCLTLPARTMPDRVSEQNFMLVPMADEHGYARWMPSGHAYSFRHRLAALGRCRWLTSVGRRRELTALGRRSCCLPSSARHPLVVIAVACRRQLAALVVVGGLSRPYHRGP
jgi:hypothetical protein